MTERIASHHGLAVGSYLYDHNFMGRGVLPAVEALGFLARAAGDLDPPLTARFTTRADFLRFLYLPSTGQPLTVITEFMPLGRDNWRAALFTETSSKSGTMTRLKEHVSVILEPWPSAPPQPPALDLLAVPPGPAMLLPASRIYEELVPFGPAFQNLIGQVHLSAAGASGLARAPEIDCPDSPLGSPFPVDAGFHLACLWGQRYAGITAFPAAYDQRLVFEPAAPRETYFCRVFPRASQKGVLQYDLWLLDLAGRPREAVLGLTMKDAFAGKMAPPEWIADRGDPGLARLSGRCAGLYLLEIGSVPEFAARVLSPREKKRADQLGEKRKKSFIAARLALKQLSRRLFPDLAEEPAAGLETVAPDGSLPSLAGEGKLFCSAAHDRRLAVAVAAETPVGIDLEQIADKAYRGRDFFMSSAEWEAAHRLDPIHAATLVWTIKEAAAKMLGLPLVTALREVEVLRPGMETSLARYMGKNFTAFHAEVADHVLTLTQSLG